MLVGLCQEVRSAKDVLFCFNGRLGVGPWFGRLNLGTFKLCSSLQPGSSSVEHVVRLEYCMRRRLSGVYKLFHDSSISSSSSSSSSASSTSTSLLPPLLVAG